MTISLSFFRLVQYRQNNVSGLHEFLSSIKTTYQRRLQKAKCFDVSMPKEAILKSACCHV